MIGESRTIARFVELYHIPIQHDIDQLRDVYLEVSSSCGYDNFMRQAGGAYLETAAGEGGAMSRVTFTKDRISFQEELSKSSLDNFRHRVEEVITVSTEKLSIPVFIVRNITVRTLAAIPGGKTATQFVMENLTELTPDDLAPFGRPALVVGLRLHVPPGGDQKSGSHQVRVEAYLRDPRSIFVEDVATFKVPVQSRDRDRIATEMSEVEDFVHERVTAFLSQFPK